MYFGQLVGQERAVGDLRFAWQQGRIPNAYLFSGPEGCGKRTTALILARLLNCSSVTQQGEPCGVCASCQKIDHETHPDIWVLEPEKQRMIKIDQIRDLRRKTRFPPQEGRLRVVVLDAIEKMNREAANAFLKLLEEPPPDNLFILCTSSPGQLLPTILSRCQRVPFAPLRRDVLSTWLSGRHQIDAERAELLAGLSEGSPGKALLLHEHLTDEQRRDLLTSLSGLSRVPDGATLALSLASRLQKQGEQLPLYLDLLRTWLRDVLLLREVQASPEQLIHRDLMLQLREHASKLSTPGLYRAVRALDHAEDALRRNAAPLLTLEQLFLTLGGVR